MIFFQYTLKNYITLLSLVFNQNKIKFNTWNSLWDIFALGIIIWLYAWV